MTRLGYAIILAGSVLLLLRGLEVVDAESADILAVLAIVAGALAVAVDAEREPREKV